MNLTNILIIIKTVLIAYYVGLGYTLCFVNLLGPIFPNNIDWFSCFFGVGPKWQTPPLVRDKDGEPFSYGQSSQRWVPNMEVYEVKWIEFKTWWFWWEGCYGLKRSHRWDWELVNLPPRLCVGDIYIMSPSFFQVFHFFHQANLHTLKLFSVKLPSWWQRTNNFCQLMIVWRVNFIESNAYVFFLVTVVVGESNP